VPDWLHSLLSNYGYWAVFLILFLNNLGLPLPGNTLLLGAGFLVGTGTLSLWAPVGFATGACFLGSDCGYWLGRRYGHPLLGKIRWLRLTHERIRHMEHFFKRYGAKGVFFARFVALMHPFIGILAGMGRTPVRPFLFYNLTGSAIFNLLWVLAGDYFGQKWGYRIVSIAHITLFILLVIVIIFFLSLFWGHSIYTFFGHPIYKRRRGGFWGKKKS